jgi:DNA-binding CsgD family transcriptional regulator
VATARARERCRERLRRLSESQLDCESLRREAIGELQRVIGFDRWCWPLADPETLLPASGLAEHDYGRAVPRALELEYSADDYAAKHVLARRANTSGSLGLETKGDFARSQRWDEVMRPVGIGDVAAVACRDQLGCWGWVEAYRDRGDRRFDQDDLDLLAGVGGHLGSALRRTMYAQIGGSRAAGPGPPGVIVLGQQLLPVSWTAGARAWIEAFPGAAMFAAFGMLPSVIYPAATIARSESSAAGSHATLRTADGRWVRIEAAPFEGPSRQIAVTLRPATAAETFDVLCRAFGFSLRERDIVAALVAGLDTRAMTERLFISPHTVQDHFKSIFAKAAVRNRRELVARLSDVAP